jgi:PAS domain S-box-containing protein
MDMRSSSEHRAGTGVMGILNRLVGAIAVSIRGIQSRLLSIFLLLSLIPLTIVGILSFQNAKSSLEASIGAQLEIKAQRISSDIEKAYIENEVSLRNWAGLPLMYDLVADDPDGRVTGLLITLARESSNLGQLIAVSVRGDIVAASQPTQIGERVAETDWFLRLLGQNSFSEPRGAFRYQSKDERLYIAVPVMSKTRPDHPIGYLVSTMEIERLKALIPAMNDNNKVDDDNVYLLDRVGRVQVSRIGDPHAVAHESFGPAALRRIHDRQSATNADSIGGWLVWQQDGGDQLIGYFHAQYGLVKGNTIAVSQSTEKAFAQVLALRNNIVTIGIILVCLALGISRVLAVRLSRPINSLTRNAEAIAAGNFTTEMLPLQRQDEIGSLARAFKRMTEELKKLTEELETRVQDRTVSLNDANRSLQNQIREREAAEDAARASEQRYYRMVSQVKGYAIIMLDPQGLVLEWNEGAEQMKGYRADEVMGKSFSIFYPDEDQQAGKPAALIAKAIEMGSATDEGWRIRRDGSRIWVYVSITAIHDDKGQLLGFSKVTRDLTQQKKAEEEKATLESKLLQSQKMESIGRLAGGIAHDFNNLLTVITGYSQLAGSSLQPDNPLFLPIREIGAAAERAANLTRQLLAFSRKQIMSPTILSLNGVVGELNHFLRRLIGEDIQLDLVYAGDLESVKADRGQIEQVIMNLVVNARDAMPKGGTLLIRTGNVEITPQQPEATGIVPNGRYVTLEVRDTGCGMDQLTMSRIFEPFFTTKEQGKGTGLGLATVYGITKQSQGYIIAESELGHGSSFTLYLPTVDMLPDSPTPLEATGRDTAGKLNGGTILLVEDESNIRRLLQGLLSTNGYKVLVAPDGEAGLVLGSSYSGSIDLLVTDVVMPKMSGADMAKRLLEKHADLKVLYMSGYTDESIVQHGVLEPGIAFLSKPFKPQALLDRVKQVLQT